jgi:hypothetical protein
MRNDIEVMGLETHPILKLAVARPMLADVAAGVEGQTEIEMFHITLARLDDMGISALPHADRLPQPPGLLHLKNEVQLVDSGQKRSCFVELTDEDQSRMKDYLLECEAITGVKLVDPNRVFHLTLSNAQGGAPRGSIGAVWEFDPKRVGTWLDVQDAPEAKRYRMAP